MIAWGHTLRIIQRRHPLAALAKLFAVTAKAACRFAVGARASRHLDCRIPRSSSFSVLALQEGKQQLIKCAGRQCSMVWPDFLHGCESTAVTVLYRASCNMFHILRTLGPTCKPMMPWPLAHCQNDINLFQQKFSLQVCQAKPTIIFRICSLNTGKTFCIATICYSH